MEPHKALKALVAVVATLGELAARVARLDWDMSPESLRAALRKFTWQLWDTLDRGAVTSLNQQGVISLSQCGVIPLGQALAALRATPGADWEDVRAEAKAWRESVNALVKSLDQLAGEVQELPGAFESKDRAKIIDFIQDLQNETASRRTAGDNLVATAWQPLVALASVVAIKAREEAVVATRQGVGSTRREEWLQEALGLLRRLMFACEEARRLTWELQCQLGHLELVLEKEQKVFLSVLQAFAATVAKAKRLSEASARVTTRHLLVTLGDIYHLLLSPSDGSGGPGGLSMAKRCREATKATLRPCKKQRTAPPHGDTNNGSSIPGTPEQPEGTWGKPEPGAVCDIASQLPRDPDLLPPGTRCELATSESIRFLNSSCHECIPIGVTGISHQTQDFLIIGKDTNRILGLSVLPAVISVNSNKELRVLALAYKAPMVIQPKTPIAIAIALPMNTNKRAVHPEMPFQSSNLHGRWIKRITNERPEQRCSLTHHGKTVRVTGKLDTGSDVTVISYEFWPRDWNLVPPDHALTGIGGGTRSMQSESMITVTGPEGKTATTRPYVVKKRITLWGRDVMSQWRAKMELDS
ncbi:uncharacterized protein LOC134565366 [Prinia subflava]|uniref:uncharacterized protein LOC134565366 n=1 Tax=Prinia subflava TaxID=208062 RepID=UPI002FE10A93